MKTHIPTHWLVLELQSTLQTHTLDIDTLFRIYVDFDTQLDTAYRSTSGAYVHVLPIARGVSDRAH